MILITMILYFVGLVILSGLFFALELTGLNADIARIIFQMAAYLVVVIFWFKNNDPENIKTKVLENQDLPISKKPTFMKIEYWISLVVLYISSDFNTLISSTLIFYVSTIMTYMLAGMLMYPLIIESNLGLKKIGFAKMLVYGVIGVVFALSFNVAYSALIEGLGLVAPSDEAVNQVIVETMIKENPIKMFLTVTFSAAIMEEIIFRGLSFRTLLHRNRFFAYALTFLVFGGIHLVAGLQEGQGLKEFIYLPVYGMMGVNFAFMYEKTESIYTSMLAHFLNNLVSFILILTQLK